VIYGKWSVQASKQANIHTHRCNEVTLVWGLLRLTPMKVALQIIQHWLSGAIFTSASLLQQVYFYNAH